MTRVKSVKPPSDLREARISSKGIRDTPSGALSDPPEVLRASSISAAVVRLWFAATSIRGLLVLRVVVCHRYRVLVWDPTLHVECDFTS